MMRQNILIIGAGEIGSSLKKILGKKPDLEIETRDKDPKKAKSQKPLAKTAPRADFLFICVPSWAVPEVAANLKKIIKRKTIIISLTKGLEKKTGKTSFEILKKFLPNNPIAVLSGPTLAEELQKGQMGIGIFACQNKKIFQQAKKLFQNTPLDLKFSSDERGVALSGILKNIYAVVLGLADGLGWGNNLKGWLVSNIVREALAVAKELKIPQETMLGEAGLGDFIATGFSLTSRNRRAGEEIVKKGKVAFPSEGVQSLDSFFKLLKRKNFPVLNCLKRILKGGKAKIFLPSLLKSR